MKVYVATVMCPSNHPVGMIFGEYKSEEEARRLLLAASQKELAARGTRDCHICGSADLRLEFSRTNFTSRAELEASYAKHKLRQRRN